MDLQSTARVIAEWPNSVGVKAVPAKVLKLVDLFDQTEWIQGPHTVIDPSKITRDNMDALTLELAETLAQEREFVTAKNQIRDAVGRELLMVAGDAVDSILSVVRPEFDENAERFVAAVQDLGDDLTPASLVRRGSEAVSRYSEAVEAQRVIGRLDKFAASLVHLPRFSGCKPDPAIRCLTVQDRNGLQKVVNAQGTHSDKLGELSLLFVTAAQSDGAITFRLNDPAEWTAMRQEIEAARYEPKRPTFLKF